MYTYICTYTYTYTYIHTHTHICMIHCLPNRYAASSKAKSAISAGTGRSSVSKGVTDGGASSRKTSVVMV